MCNITLIHVCNITLIQDFVSVSDVLFEFPVAYYLRINQGKYYTHTFKIDR